MGITQAKAFYDGSFDLVSIYLRDGRRYAKPVEMDENEERAVYREPVARITLEAAQMLMDSLWNAGLRPIAGKQSEGVTAAQAAHLTDMRAIAFAKLNIPTPTTGD